MYCPNPDCPDYLASGQPGEYVEGITVCPFCETELVEEEPDMEAIRAAREHVDEEPAADEPETTDELDEELVVIANCADREHAEIATTYLMEHDIDVFESDDPFGDRGVTGFDQSIQLLTLESQAERATELLEKLEKELEQEGGSGADR